MTKHEIVMTAFKVWGRKLYLDTSLSELARELGVSKTALYRHFENKQALLDAMCRHFFDDYAAFIKPAYERSVRAEDKAEGFMLMVRAITEYYVRNMDAFVFSRVYIYGGREKTNIGAELKCRGIDMGRISMMDDCAYPSLLQLVFTTLMFGEAYFYKYAYASGEVPPGKAVQTMVDAVEEKITRGLGLRPEQVEAMDFDNLERLVLEESPAKIEDDGLLRAVAGAVAEAGPWKASMEMVAQRSGLSKSGLYAHFKSKKDMLIQLFLTEINRIISYANSVTRNSEEPLEQLYLTVMTVAFYFKSRPDFLYAIDWIKVRRLNLGDAVPLRVYRLFADIKIDALHLCTEDGAGDDAKYTVSRWILFLIVNTLIHWPHWKRTYKGEEDRDVLQSCGALFRGGKELDIPNTSIRRLFRFIVVGLQGFKI
ncbi:MAG: TetR/AcrR family transcriptional regulator [Treponema sp.]|jgi:AcrR family transcriptional regulator|nr:TetR/AcrR family transcriptional regulator [Treponema sp.]